MGFRDKMKGMKKDLIKTTQDSIDKRESSMEYGSIFIKENIPDGMEFWKPDYGDHLVDVIPFQIGGSHPNYPEGQWTHVIDLEAHMNIGNMFDDFVCQVRNDIKGNDPICDFIRSCPRTGPGSLSTDQYKVIAPKRRCVYLVWVHDTPEEEAKGIQIWELAHWNSERHIAGIAKHPKGGAPVPFADVDDGKTIAFQILKTGKYVDNQGKEQDSKDFSSFRFVDRETPIPDDFDEQIFCLDDCIKWRPSWEEQAKAFPMPGVSNTPVASLPLPPSQEKQLDDKPIDDGAKEKEEKPKRSARRRASSEPAPEPAEGECPGGGTFGVDMEKLPHCNKCEVWDACADEADKIMKSKKDEPKKEPEPETPKKKTMIRRRRRS